MTFTVAEELDGISVRTFLRRYCSVSARTLAKLKRTENGIMLGDRQIRSIDILHSGDVLTLNFPQDTTHIEPADIPVAVAYEDDCVIIFDKPAGMLDLQTHK